MLQQEILHSLKQDYHARVGQLVPAFLNGFPPADLMATNGLLSYPIDTIRRRMMMTSGQAVKYAGSMDCGRQILKVKT